jgi:hypothetical protein
MCGIQLRGKDCRGGASIVAEICAACDGVTAAPFLRRPISPGQAPAEQACGMTSLRRAPSYFGKFSWTISNTSPAWPCKTARTEYIAIP